MRIDDDYCQYDTFRIINKADADAIKQFDADKTQITDPAAQTAALAAWREKAEALRDAEETEESVYQLTFAERMVQCWMKVLPE